MSDASLFQAVLRLPETAALAVTDLMEGLESPAPVSVSTFEIPGETDFQISALYETPPAVTYLQTTLGPLLQALGLPVPDIEVTPLADRNWVRESLQGLPAVSAGRFFMAGAHEMNMAPPGAITLCVEAGEAFGTGHHGSTSGCLLALDALARQRKFHRVLDLGCGTGVLAMAAAKLWRLPVVASDIDPIAVRVTADNARQNGLSGLLRPVLAAGFASRQISAYAPYDLIIANILAGPLISLAPSVARHLAPGGHIVLSGLLNHQEMAVRGAYQAQRLYLDQYFRQAEWSTLVLSR